MCLILNFIHGRHGSWMCFALLIMRKTIPCFKKIRKMVIELLLQSMLTMKYASCVVPVLLQFYYVFREELLFLYPFHLFLLTWNCEWGQGLRCRRLPIKMQWLSLEFCSMCLWLFKFKDCVINRTYMFVKAIKLEKEKMKEGINWNNLFFSLCWTNFYCACDRNKNWKRMNEGRNWNNFSVLCVENYFGCKGATHCYEQWMKTWASNMMGLLLQYRIFTVTRCYIVLRYCTALLVTKLKIQWRQRTTWSVPWSIILQWNILLRKTAAI